MIRGIWFLIVACLLAAPAAPASRFTTVEVWVDAGAESLAAWQVEFATERGDAGLVGVEGGAHAAFREAPYYDPRALSGGRIIVAAFSTGTDLPTGRTRVATLHLEERGGVTPQYIVKLMAAARADGVRIPAGVSIARGE